jgi:hypothetical protein
MMIPATALALPARFVVTHLARLRIADRDCARSGIMILISRGPPMQSELSSSLEQRARLFIAYGRPARDGQSETVWGHSPYGEMPRTNGAGTSQSASAL